MRRERSAITLGMPASIPYAALDRLSVGGEPEFQDDAVAGNQLA